MCKDPQSSLYREKTEPKSKTFLSLSFIRQNMFHIILYQPEIPPNTGNIIRLCANSGCQLHLIHPLGFVWDNKRVKRAGLDYHEFAHVDHHQDLDQCLNKLGACNIFALTSKGKTRYHEPNFNPGDAFIFGPETRGLPSAILDQTPASHQLVIPQQKTSRSLNLSNSVSIMVYEALRQQNFPFFPAELDA